MASLRRYVQVAAEVLDRYGLLPPNVPREAAISAAFGVALEVSRKNAAIDLSDIVAVVKRVDRIAMREFGAATRQTRTRVIARLLATTEPSN
jgi:hypothetical protein